MFQFDWKNLIPLKYPWAKVPKIKSCWQLSQFLYLNHRFYNQLSSWKVTQVLPLTGFLVSYLPPSMKNRLRRQAFLCVFHGSSRFLNIYDLSYLICQYISEKTGVLRGSTCSGNGSCLKTAFFFDTPSLFWESEFSLLTLVSQTGTHFYHERNVWAEDDFLVGGWTNPSEKYESQNGNLPRIGVKIKNIWNRHLVFVPIHNMVLDGWWTQSRTGWVTAIDRNVYYTLFWK